MATKTETLRVRVTPEIKTWLERSARCKGGDTTLSDVAREHLRTAYEQRKTR